MKRISVGGRSNDGIGDASALRLEPEAAATGGWREGFDALYPHGRPRSSSMATEFHGRLDILRRDAAYSVWAHIANDSVCLSWLFIQSGTDCSGVRLEVRGCHHDRHRCEHQGYHGHGS